jgi:hypothetical protein
VLSGTAKYEDHEEKRGKEGVGGDESGVRRDVVGMGGVLFGQRPDRVSVIRVEVSTIDSVKI